MTEERTSLINKYINLINEYNNFKDDGSLVSAYTMGTMEDRMMYLAEIIGILTPEENEMIKGRTR